MDTQTLLDPNSDFSDVLHPIPFSKVCPHSRTISDLFASALDPERVGVGHMLSPFTTTAIVLKFKPSTCTNPRNFSSLYGPEHFVNVFNCVHKFLSVLFGNFNLTSGAKFCCLPKCVVEVRK